MNQKVFTSINITKSLSNKLEKYAENLGVDQTELLSVLCYKAGKHLCKEAQILKTVEYQERDNDYEITPVWFYAADHEYIHACRLVCKVSVSKLLACAMVMFLDEIMEKGINQLEVAQLRIIQNSYKKKYYSIRNYTFKILQNVQFQEFIMNMRMKKRKKT